MLTDTLERANEIQDEAATRLDNEKSDSINTKLALLHFETPQS